MLIRMTTYAAAVALLGAAVSAQPIAAQSGTTTLIGCVYEEKDAPGRSPNIAERAGIGEDYILAELSPAEAAKPSTDSSVPTTYSMYKLEKVADTQLKALIGKRVEATGKIDAKGSDASGQPASSVATNNTDRAIGRDRINLPEFEVASIKAVSGSCPVRPSTTN